ncbi:MAG: hypothetical protein AAFV01_09735 [Bacteroidota bacterium]
MFYTPESLAATIRAERARLKLSQEDAANRLVGAGRYDSISKQAVSKAENYQENDGMNAVRVALFEVLTGRTLEGPGWHHEDE